MKKNSILGLTLITILLLSACRSGEKVHTVGEFVPENDEFWEVIPKSSVIDRIGINFEFTEGPAWHPKGYLIFSDIPANTIYKWEGKRFSEYRKPSNMSNGILAAQGGELFICEHESRRLTRLSPDGSETVLADNYDGRRLNSPNDLCRSHDGVVYFTDPPYGLKERNEDPDKEIPYSGVFALKDGIVSLVDSSMSWPNGIALSPSGDYLYVANMNKIEEGGETLYDVFWKRFKIEEDGSIGTGEIFYRAADTSLPGGPDGMKVDKNGNIFATGPGGILIIKPDGTYLGRISLPIAPTNLTFGPRENVLYITARSTLYRVQFQ